MVKPRAGVGLFLSLTTISIFLELLAAFLALQSFVSQSNIHVRLKLDNTTAVSYINNMGGIRSEPLNTLAKKIWHWCMSREIWLSAQYVPGDLKA